LYFAEFFSKNIWALDDFLKFEPKKEKKNKKPASQWWVVIWPAGSARPNGQNGLMARVGRRAVTTLGTSMAAGAGNGDKVGRGSGGEHQWGKASTSGKVVGYELTEKASNEGD
jgi:hypothetical protein